VPAASDGSLAGWVQHVECRKPVYEVNCFGAQRFSTDASESLPMSQVTLIMTHTYQGESPKGGTTTLNVDGKEVVSGKVGSVFGSILSPLLHDKVPFVFEGLIGKVGIVLNFQMNVGASK